MGNWWGVYALGSIALGVPIGVLALACILNRRRRNGTTLLTNTEEGLEENTGHTVGSTNGLLLKSDILKSGKEIQDAFSFSSPGSKDSLRV